MNSALHTFRIHWLDGKVQEIQGKDATDAFRRAGVGAGALGAVDYWEQVADSSMPDFPDERADSD